MSRTDILMNEAVEKVRKTQELQARIQSQMAGLSNTVPGM